MRHPAAAATLALVLALAGAAPALAGAVAAPSPADAPVTAATTSNAVTDAPRDIGDAFAQTGDIEADRVVLRATLQPDGDAQWRIAYRIELTDQNTTDAFESLQSDIRANSSAYVSRFESRMTTTVGAAENATGREMQASNFSVTAQRNPFPTSNDYGVVAYTFTWEGFAATQGNRLVAGDALAGLFLDSGTVLTVAWPDDYEVRSVTPEADEPSETAVTWRGERNFGPDQPRVTVAPASALPFRPAYIAAAAVLLLGIGAATVLRRRGDLPIGDDDATTLAEEPPGGAAGTAADGATADNADGDSAADVDGGAAAGDASEDGTADADDGAVAAGTGSDGEDTDEADAAGGAEEDDTTPPEELLSPHERVVRLVEDNGGRMKQADVTEALDWSAARTSQVVGDLRDDGTIESFRLGRENVLRLPEADDDPHPGDPHAEDTESGDAADDDADAGGR
ncbi:helix-turn-helix transcriptional regulator [Halobaculum limi]|uniref:helix-turn-helix transcriptional regulator n=1 Tax=Halobaculum limi TaxID=3031916 RepID=UPI00240642AA|nr:hypothetical protein [Halobaculum sp. YSMS11]